MTRVQGRWDTHWDAGHNWALVLAAGEGSRLQSLTMTASGVAIPKQFCSLGTSPSLLDDALRRARAVASPERTCAIVAEQHRRWWQALPLDIPAENLIRQPHNRGTANGILLPLLRIVHRDPEANLLVLPSDHYVRNEEVLATSLQQAMSALERDSEHLILLGITPEEPDPELGYIVGEGVDEDGIRAVRAFVEKPSANTARELIETGGVWNSFIFAVNAQTLLRVFEERCVDLVREMKHIVSKQNDAQAQNQEIAKLYEQLPQVDFSREVLQRSPGALKVLTVPPCGWSDLGTPRRVAETVHRYGAARRASIPEKPSMAAFLDLAARHTHASAAAQMQ
ncbi:MAG TPA: sugar phosphate nucleotidyltransferase [Steroidobacteraceae bacterium]